MNLAHTILDGNTRQGHYVRTHMAREVHGMGWWGEGKSEFFMDSDGEQ
ncbi:MAG: DUF2961 domain-containing protein [bacterium]